MPAALFSIRFLLSLIIVAFGQPAFSSRVSFFAATVGYALIFSCLIEIPQKSRRFWVGTLWFTLVQAVQLSWMLTHPYIYIYIVHAIFSFLLGLQFGFFALFLLPRWVDSLLGILALAGGWTLLEWSRLFFFSGFTWNPSGLALSSFLTSLQFASIGGVYFLSFWVILSNLLVLKAWRSKKLWVVACLFVIATPFLYGWVHLKIHEKRADEYNKTHIAYSILLVQTAFPVEEILDFKDQNERIAYVVDEWKQILKIVKPYVGTRLDLVVLPEFTVPYGTYSFIYPHSIVEEAFKSTFGAIALDKLPDLKSPLAHSMKMENSPGWIVNNGYWAQGISNILNAELVVGLEDVEDNVTRDYYSSAFHLSPGSKGEAGMPLTRYDKRVLVPMGEYIPFSFCRKLAESYGVYGSFTCGSKPLVVGSRIPMGLCICYEETFGDLIRENRLEGAEILINLTSDIWYPGSRLMQQHFDHARLRSVENGIPLARSCNTGITGAFDSLGRIVSTLGEDPLESEWISDALKVDVPPYHYATLYSYLGDRAIIGLSIFFISLCSICSFCFKKMC